LALTPGTRLGAYEIVSAIGAGGMGEVYRARDTKLDRLVAIKILPDSVAHDSERIARFEREAKTLAALNHPNIATIYGVEEADGLWAIAMELIEGPTLADVIARAPDAESPLSRPRDSEAGAARGAGAPRGLELDDVLLIARQIAGAVDAAHEQGIVHRDLKPANIKLRPDGTVKVLDFGLAKALEPVGVSSSASQSPTITTPAMTQAGMILGTAAYVSPEQAKGRPADKRADVWAFGCVLYEMLTGRRASMRTGTRHLFWQAANGTGTAEQLVDGNRQVIVAYTVSPDGRYLVFRGATQSSSELMMVDRGAAPSAQRPSFGVGEQKPLVQTSFEEINAEISPDGRWLAYQSNSSGAFEVYVRPFPDVATNQYLVSTGGGTEPLWSRDSRELFYRAPKGAVMRVSIANGPTWTAGTPLRLFEATPYVLAESGQFAFRTYDVSSDGRRFLMLRNPDTPAEAAPEARIVLVQNWFEELKRAVPTK
jgi:serine/threonine protein kinase